MVHEKDLSTKDDVLTLNQKSLNYFDKEYCFKLVKSKPERIKAVLKAQERAIKY